MKRLAITLTLILGCLALEAQEVTYSLPYTSFTIEVEAVQETHFAGPYSQFAREMLNINVPALDEKETYIREVRIVPKVEADPVAPRYTCPAGGNLLMEMSAQGLISFSTKAEEADWRFTPEATADFSKTGITGSTKKVKNITYRTVKTDSSDVRYPVEHLVTVDKTLEDKAAEAAEKILSAREERYNIATGNTDANYSGESMSAALKELSKVEKEYMKLFTGYSTQRYVKASFEVLPTATARTNRYTAFYITEDGELTREGSSRSKVYELEFTPVAVPDVRTENTDAKKKSDKYYTIHYRIPAVCRVRLLENGKTLLETRVPVYQLGREAEMPVNL